MESKFTANTHVPPRALLRQTALLPPVLHSQLLGTTDGHLRFGCAATVVQADGFEVPPQRQVWLGGKHLVACLQGLYYLPTLHKRRHLASSAFILYQGESVSMPSATERS